jgi:hypothetical protein
MGFIAYTTIGLRQSNGRYQKKVAGRGPNFPLIISNSIIINDLHAFCRLSPGPKTLFLKKPNSIVYY